MHEIQRLVVILTTISYETFQQGKHHAVICFCGTIDSTSLPWDTGLHKPELIVCNDASGAWVCAVFYEPYWLQFEWPPRLSSLLIAVMEMIPVVLAPA